MGCQPPVDAKAIIEELEITKRCLFQAQEAAKAIRAEALVVSEQRTEEPVKQEPVELTDDEFLAKVGYQHRYACSF